MKLPLNKRLYGKIKLLGDKSLAHRAMFFCSLAKGNSRITNFPETGVIKTLLDCLRNLGIDIHLENNTLTVIGNQIKSLKNSKVTCNCQNSATTMRLLIGFLIGTQSNVDIIGSESLMKRPIRVDEIFKSLGYENLKTNSGYLPARVQNCQSISKQREINTKYQSAQVKTSLILSAIGKRKKELTIFEDVKTRDHTENMLKSMGAEIDINHNKIVVKPLQRNLNPLVGELPGDISSAAFILVAAATIPNSHIEVEDVLLNPCRLGFIDVLRQTGCLVEVKVKKKIFGENVGTIVLDSPNDLKPIIIEDQQQVVDMIDEFPAISVLMAKTKGISKVRNANELRYKESDRISSIVNAYKQIGLECIEYQDGFDVYGKKELYNNIVVKTNNDHRIAMAFYVLGLTTGIVVDDENIINESFLDFKETLKGLIK